MIQGTQVVLRKDPHTPDPTTLGERFEIPSTGVSRAQTPMIGRLHSARCPVSTTFSRTQLRRSAPRCLDAMWTTGSGRSLFRQFSNSWAIMLWLWRLWLEKPWKNMRKPWIPHGKKHMERWFCQNKNGPGNPWWQWWWYHGCYGNHGKHLWGLKIGFTQNSCV